MQTGTYISGIGHVALIGWALFGGIFDAEPLPMQVTEVSVISSEEFAALTAPQDAPQATDEPEGLSQLEEPAQALPEVTATPEPETQITQPELAPTPEPEPVPEITQPEPLPQAEVTETAPEIQPPSEDVAVIIPPSALRPRPRPVERVAPQAVAAPPPDAQPDEVEQEAVEPDEGAETPQEPQEATAPEEATTEIVTEADEPAELAPLQSRRPPSRPARPQRTAEQTPEPDAQPTPQSEDPAQAQPDTSSAVNAALAEALGEASPQGEGEPASQAPSGPPLSAGERDALRVAVSNCWNVGSLSSEALATTVVVAVSMNADGRPVTGSIRKLSHSDGSEAAARQAFEAARRAIIRCGANGYDLPTDKFDQWREIEMTFNPESMRIR